MIIIIYLCMRQLCQPKWFARRGILKGQPTIKSNECLCISHHATVENTKSVY